ncbi:AlbA family DNA-binding domain-containing protein [Saccharopolyspora hirsuta]|nr:ATP-binding protein [Saccharopolyspora hirsuta]
MSRSRRNRHGGSHRGGRRRARPGRQGELHQPLLDDLLAEFKTTARRNMGTGEVAPKKAHAIVRTVCGLLNAEGGTLLIGVGDSGDVVGGEEDMATLGKGNGDAYELVLDSNLSSPTAATVRINFHQVRGRVVCELIVAPSSQPVFANPPTGEGPGSSDFWVLARTW